LPKPHAVQTKYSSVAPFDVLEVLYGDLAVQGRLARLASISWSMVTFPQILKL
jgi:hypothetical protein